MLFYLFEVCVFSVQSANTLSHIVLVGEPFESSHAINRALPVISLFLHNFFKIRDALPCVVYYLRFDLLFAQRIDLPFNTCIQNMSPLSDFVRISPQRRRYYLERRSRCRPIARHPGTADNYLLGLEFVLRDHGGIGGEIGCNRCRNSSVSIRKSQ